MTGCQIDLYKNCVAFNNGLTVLPLQTFDSFMALLTSSKHVCLPPHSKALISVRLIGRAVERFGSTVIIEPYIAAQQRGFLVAKAFVNRPKNGQLPCRVLNPFNKPFSIPRGFAIATLSSAVLQIDSRYTPATLQRNFRQLTINLSDQGRRAQASSSSGRFRNNVAACSSGSSSEHAAEKSSRWLEGEVALQRAASTQQTSDVSECLDSARAKPKVSITLSEKVSYLRSKGFFFGYLCG